MVGMKRVATRAALVLVPVLLLLLLLGGCQVVDLRDWIAGFFDPIVGEWKQISPALTPPENNAYVFRPDRTYTRNQVLIGNIESIIQGTYIKDDSAGNLTLTPSSWLLDGVSQSTPAPATAALIMNTERTLVQLTVGTDPTVTFSRVN